MPKLKKSYPTAIAGNKPDIIAATRSEADTMMNKILLAILLAFVLAGCGQSGPLYVPGDPSSVQQPQPVPDAEDEGEDDGDDEDR